MVLAAVLDMLLGEDGDQEGPVQEDHPEDLQSLDPAAQASEGEEGAEPCSVMCLPWMPNTLNFDEETAGTGSTPEASLDSDIQ